MDTELAIRPPVFREQIRFRLHDIFLVCKDQGDASTCNFLIPFDDDSFLEEDGVVVGISGQVFTQLWGYGVFGVNIDDVVMNYTQYLEQHTAARRIQRAWKRYKASKVIKRAWKRWLTKKNELWNPHCFVGVAFLALEAVRATC